MTVENDDWELDDYLERLSTFDDEIDQVTLTDFGTEVFSATWESLHSYQQEGCKWMYRLYQTGVGGILGDEMGLGKTAQLCAHFGSLSRNRENRNAIFLILCPATLLRHWLKEMHRWSPAVRTILLHDISRTGGQVSKRTEKFVEASLKRLQYDESSRGVAVISTYEGIRLHKESFHRIEWTSVCLDEGQRLRNPQTMVSQLCKALPCYHRLVLSGTPIQNSLKELWSVFDFIYPGRLGLLSAFEIEFASPIRAGGYSSASKLQVEIANQTATVLQRIVRPYILRRKKDDMQHILQLPKKTEQILFCKLSPRQDAIYDAILASDEVKAVLQRRMTSFRAIMTLRKLCNHPELVYRGNQIIWHKENHMIYHQHQQQHHNHQVSTPFKKGTKRSRHDKSDHQDADNEDHDMVDDHVLQEARWSDSGKLLVLSKVLPLWHKQGHKVLIFSQMTGMLDLVEHMLHEYHFSYHRLDGSTSINKRSSIIDSFNQDDTIFIMLLTTLTGGLGISLTAANRVLLLDPNWNPMTDIQARERSWRIGQQREVTIYRLISRGTIEEKIYQRQIFKILLSKRILDNPKQKALFSKSDLKELFQRTDDSQSSAVWKQPHHDDSGSSSSSSGVDHDLPMGGEVMIYDSTTANEEYVHQLLHQQGLDDDDDDNGNDDDDDDRHDGVKAMMADESDQLGIVDEEKMMLEDKDVVMAYRSLTKPAISTSDDDDDDDHGDDEVDDNYTIEEMKPAPKRSSSSSSSGKKSSEVAQDKKLLESLFNGDAITGVYDHNFLEDITSSSSRRQRTNAIEDVAARSVEDAMRRVEASSSHTRARQAIGLTGDHHRAGMSVSANLLASIRERQNTSSSSSSSSSQSMSELIDSRLRQLFSHHPNGLSSERILAHFPDLGDHHAVLFKQLLKAMAVMHSGIWTIKPQL